MGDGGAGGGGASFDLISTPAHMSAQTDQPPLVAISALKAADCLHNE